MKTITPTEYQSLPVNEKSNWKEQWQVSDKSKLHPIKWLDIDYEFVQHFKDIGFETQLIYIPINPESVLNAEMVEQDKIIENGLKSGGFLFPETVNQVEAYEKHFGPGDNQELPDDLKDPHFLNKHISANRTLEVIAETLYPKGDINSHFLTTPLRMSERKAFIAGHSQGKKDHNKEVIDIVEAEIAKLPTNKMSQHAISVDPKTTLTDLLTKLKEIT